MQLQKVVILPTVQHYNGGKQTRPAEKSHPMLKFVKITFCQRIRTYCSDIAGKMKILNVAEKNDAAKNIAELLSHGRSQRVSKRGSKSLPYYCFHFTNFCFAFRKKDFPNSTRFTNFNAKWTAVNAKWKWPRCPAICSTLTLKKSTGNGIHVRHYNFLICLWPKRAEKNLRWRSNAP